MLVLTGDQAYDHLPITLMFEKILTVTTTPAFSGDETYLEKFRLSNGLAFPPSYVRFCKELGYGRLCSLFLIYIPFENAAYPDSFQVQSVGMKSLFNEYLDPPLDAISQVENGPELIRHAEPFARTENGEFLFWDSRHPLPDGELPIYYTDFSGGISHAGNSLIELIGKITHREAYRSVLYFYKQPLKPVFEPFTAILT